MSEVKTLEVFVKANADLQDAVLSKSDGAAKLDRGVRELVAGSFPGVVLSVTSEPSSGLAELRTELEEGTSTLISATPDIVLLSVADDVALLPDRAVNAEEGVRAARADLAAVIDMIKAKVGAHILVAGVSTVDPADETFDYRGLTTEPFSLRAHRLDLMLVGVSHDEGISVIDVDRVVAEVGGGIAVAGAADYTPVGCAAIAAEVVRILEDYGFFDDRQLLAQVGAKKGNA